MKRYLEFRDGTSEKFWEIAVAKNIVTTRWGRIGSKGQFGSREYETAAAAERASLKLIAEKTKKGYRKAEKAAVKPKRDSVPPGVPAHDIAIQTSLDKIADTHGILVVDGALDPATLHMIVTHKNAKQVRQIRQKSWKPINLKRMKNQHARNIAEFKRLFRINIPDFIFEMHHYHECMNSLVKGAEGFQTFSDIDIHGFNTLDCGIFKHVFTNKLPVEKDALSLRYRDIHLNYFPVFSYGEDYVTQGLIFDYQENALAPFIGYEGGGDYYGEKGIWNCLLDTFREVFSSEYLRAKMSYFTLDPVSELLEETEYYYDMLLWAYSLATTGYVNFHGLPSIERDSRAHRRYKEHLSDADISQLLRNGKFLVTDDYCVYPTMQIEFEGNFNPVFSRETLESFLALFREGEISPQMLRRFVTDTNASTSDVLELLGLNAKQWQSKKTKSKGEVDKFLAAVEKLCLDEIEDERPYLAFLVGLYAWAGAKERGTELAGRLLQEVPDEICHPLIKTVARLHSKTRFDRRIYL